MRCGCFSLRAVNVIVQQTQDGECVGKVFSLLNRKIDSKIGCSLVTNKLQKMFMSELVEW